MRTITFIFCHTQEFILQSIENKKYKDIGTHYYVFMGFGDIDRITSLDFVIICRALSDNIEKDVHCLQYCGWYALDKNANLDCDLVRLIDYDVDILKVNNETQFEVKSGLSFDFGFYFDYGFKNSDVFVNYVKSKTGKSISNLIADYKKVHNQTQWFSIGDVLIKTSTFKKFMEWFYPIYLDNRHLQYFAHHFERYITVFCLEQKMGYEIKKDEIIHNQLKSHKYY